MEKVILAKIRMGFLNSPWMMRIFVAVRRFPAPQKLSPSPKK